MEKDKITTDILNAISSIVGIVGFADLDFLNDSEDLKNENYQQIIINDNNCQLNISIGIIILSNVSAKSIIEQIYQTINYTLNKNKINLGNLDIFIRGIQ
ncbi:hypothetical protein [Mycoplasma zalophi]|uniref:Asp23/Gls24 family envelope stress response protein n=1 Tax=Mycoplasma zalophi TaxID=191287 RepID=A0ABS6DP50_9MOLU|nr:hypothetical protein [Mycoplasma zalophi]MBU4691139.1 hypothetical protein [Mycoplasma zalophi]MBU4692089.1 hypothetical protein [Mycoplasma zalophi]